MSRNQFDDMIKKYLTSALKEKGFKKHHFVWNKKLDDIVHVVDVQKSRWSSPGEISFTINVGVWIKQNWAICWGDDFPKVIKEVDCFPRFRIGKLLHGESLDEWWKIREDNIEQVGSEVKSVIQNKCFPFFEKCHSLNQISEIAGDIENWKQPAERIAYAVLKYLDGEKKLSEKILAELEDEAVAWQPRIQQVRNKLNHIT